MHVNRQPCTTLAANFWNLSEFSEVVNIYKTLKYAVDSVRVSPINLTRKYFTNCASS